MTDRNDDANREVRKIKYEKDTYDELITAIKEYRDAKTREEVEEKFEKVQEKIIKYRNYWIGRK